MVSNTATNTNSINFKAAILSISLVFGTGGSISAVLPAMQKALPNVNETGINLIATIPQAGVIVFLLLSGIFVNAMGIKKTILTGLLIMGFSGIVPIFSESYWLILISRFIFGAGIGLFNALAITIINLNFTGKEESKLLGFRGSMEGIGSTIASLLVGALVVLGWHAVFAVYFLVFIIAIYFWRFGPDISIDHKQQQQHPGQEIDIKKVNFKVWILGLVLILLVMVQIVVIIQIPRILINRNIATTGVASIIVALNTFAGMFGGILFGNAYTKLGKTSFTAFLAGDAIGLLILSLSTNLITAVLGTILVGVFGSFMCVAAFNLMTNVTEPSERANANTILLLGCNIGSFAAPFGIKLMQEILSNNVASPFIGFAITLLVVSILFFIVRNSFYRN
ncbi:MFS transporter [Leuconostoc suionicum]|uniref:MFS transporter n=1 Tax=Leuconostoc suionicum TaxID=1511761 RepID=UPI0032DE9521